MYVIFLDLHKVYDALERDRCLDILEGYGVGGINDTTSLGYIEIFC